MAVKAYYPHKKISIPVYLSGIILMLGEGSASAEASLFSLERASRPFLFR